MIIVKKRRVLRDVEKMDWNWLKYGRLGLPSKLVDVNRRIDACAIILSSEPDAMREEAISAETEKESIRLFRRADRLDSVIDAIMDGKSVDRLTACKIAVKGRMRGMVRSGQARNIFDAIDQYERRQDKDKAVSVSASDGSLAREVSRLEAMTGHSYTVIRNGQRYVYDDGTDAKIAEKKAKTKAYATERAGRLVQRLKVEIEDLSARCSTEYMATEEYIISAYDDIGRYVRAYVADLTPTLRKALMAIRDSTLTDTQILADRSATRYQLVRLRSRFNYADALTPADFLTLIRKYA